MIEQLDATPMKTDKAKPEKPKQYSKEVAEQVRDTIGRSPDFVRISAIHLFGYTYRVNVYRKLPGEYGCPDITRITDSYFTVTDEDGKIVKSDPPVEKKYG